MSPQFFSGKSYDAVNSQSSRIKFDPSTFLTFDITYRWKRMWGSITCPVSHAAFTYFFNVSKRLFWEATFTKPFSQSYAIALSMRPEKYLQTRKPCWAIRVHGRRAPSYRVPYLFVSTLVLNNNVNTQHVIRKLIGQYRGLPQSHAVRHLSLLQPTRIGTYTSKHADYIIWKTHRFQYQRVGNFRLLIVFLQPWENWTTKIFWCIAVSHF
jgi:hypothetical protein